jgi:hypothetical protein
MKGPAIERLARTHLLPVLPGFVVRRSLLYRRPFDYFLHGLSFDTSSFSSSRIFVEAFIQPLYEPYDYLTYTYGFRLGADFWDVDEQHPDQTFAAIAEAARRDALPFFGEMTDLDRFCELVPKWATATPRRVMQSNTLDDPVVAEDLGYTEILRGNIEEGVRLLEQAIAYEREDGEDADEERIGNVQEILDRVQDGGREAAQALLEDWRIRTITALRLQT